MGERASSLIDTGGGGRCLFALKSSRTDPVRGDLTESALAAVEIDRTSTRRSGALDYGPCVRVCSSQWCGESGGSVGDRGQCEVKKLMRCVQRLRVCVF